MPYIVYKITNDVNDKVYIGRTAFTLKKRFAEHKNEATKDKIHRPIYDAMREIGTDHFQITEIETVETEQEANEREMFWIDYYNSVLDGYNTTLGGVGKHYADYDAIYNLWQQGKSSIMIQQELKYDQHTIKVALESFGVTSKEIIQRRDKSFGNKVEMLDKSTGTVLQTFDTITDAHAFLDKKRSGHITQICQGKRKQAYGYKWRYVS